jgi:hypothetical protein
MNFLWKVKVTYRDDADKFRTENLIVEALNIVNAIGIANETCQHFKDVEFNSVNPYYRREPLKSQKNYTISAW